MSRLLREGHRQRLRDTYANNGINNMPYHNVLELILTYAIPRRDVKDTAYGLMNHFDNDIGKVFSADYEELCKVNGVGESAAVLIKLFHDIYERSSVDEVSDEAVLIDYVSTKEYIDSEFSDVREETLYILHAENSGNIICREVIASGKIDFAGLDLRSIVESIIKNNSASAIIVRVNPNGGYRVTDEDIALVQKLRSVLEPIKIELLDYVVVGNDGSLAMAYDCRYLTYFMVNGVKK